MFPRKLYKDLKGHLDEKQITVLTGMRRTGKTTLVKQLLADIPSENKIYIDLERVDNRELFSEKNYDAILHALAQRGLDTAKKAWVALDELQLAPSSPSVLKYLYDNHDIKFLVTGSSSFYLKNLFTESLAGRKKIFELYPLDFGEFLAFKGVPFVAGPFESKKFSAAEYERLKVHYDEYIEHGGFPEVVLAEGIAQKKDLVADIVSSYINIDVRALADFRDQRNLYALMKMLASRAGNRLDYAKLARMADMARPTVMNYVEFLEKTYVIARIPVVTKNPDREIVKAQKLYFYDNGILNSLADAGSGAKFENALFTQLHHRGELRYYALKSGREIDFILDGTVALEAKESPAAADARALAELAGRIDIKRCRLVGRNRVAAFDDYVWGGEIR